MTRLVPHGNGQFCAKPGLRFVPDDSQLLPPALRDDNRPGIHRLVYGTWTARRLRQPGTDPAHSEEQTR